MFAPEFLGGFHFPEFEARKLNNLIAQNWSLVGARITFRTPAQKDSNPHDSAGLKLLMSEHAFFVYRAAASAKRTNGDYMNWAQAPISIASEAPKFTFMPLDGQPVVKAIRMAFFESRRLRK